MEHDLKLTLAVAETCGPESCQVRMVDDGRSITARYSALVLNRLKIRPGQLVAIDLDPAEPEVAWRWHQARVLETTPTGARIMDPGGHQFDAIQVPGLETSLTAGDEIWVTGFEETFEIHAKIINGEPERADRVKALVLPRVVEALSKKTAA
jgi:hypothetical protein